MKKQDPTRDSTEINGRNWPPKTSDIKIAIYWICNNYISLQIKDAVKIWAMKKYWMNRQNFKKQLEPLEIKNTIAKIKNSVDWTN